MFYFVYWQNHQKEPCIFYMTLSRKNVLDCNSLCIYMPAYCLSRITAEALTPQRRMIWEKIKPCNASAVISVYTIAYENRTNRTNRTNFQFSSKNLWYSFLTPSSVALRPIFIATCRHVSSSKSRYLMIRCIRTGIVLSQASTWLLICAAAAFRSSRINSSRSSCPGFSSTEWAMPSTLKLFAAKGKSCMDPFTASTTNVFRFF